MVKTVRAPKSPWQKYNKSSFVYSSTYQEWKRAAKENGAHSPQALAMACHHAKMMHVDATACRGDEKSV